MKKLLSLLLLFSLGICIAKATDIEKVKPVKNVILLIPDGTSLQTVSLARWCQWYQNPDKPHLNIDPFKRAGWRLRSYYLLLYDRISQHCRVRIDTSLQRRR